LWTPLRLIRNPPTWDASVRRQSAAVPRLDAPGRRRARVARSAARSSSAFSAGAAPGGPRCPVHSAASGLASRNRSSGGSPSPGRLRPRRPPRPEQRHACGTGKVHHPELRQRLLSARLVRTSSTMRRPSREGADLPRCLYISGIGHASKRCHVIKQLNKKLRLMEGFETLESAER
jgi:hypothetical protein